MDAERPGVHKPSSASGGCEGEDSFAVYDGTVESPLNRAPLWRYVAKNGLRSPDVPAVESFVKPLQRLRSNCKNAAEKP